MIKKFTALLLCSLLVLVCAGNIHAELVTPTSANATSFLGFNPPSLLIDGSGLDGIGDVRDQLHDNVEANNWLTDAFAPPPTSDVDLIFELDGQYDLSAAYIWNFNNIAGNPPTINTNFRGVKEFDLLVSSIPGDPTDVFGDPGNFAFVGNFTLDQANVTGPGSSDPERDQMRAFVADDVRRVKFEIISNFAGDIPIVDDVVGLSEVRFWVPEPAAGMLVALGGLALIGFRRRRHKK